MRGHGTALAHLLFLAARRRPHEFGLHGCLLRSHPLTLPTAPISFNFLAVNDIAAAPVHCGGPRTGSAPAGPPLAGASAGVLLPPLHRLAVVPPSPWSRRLPTP